MPYSDTGSVNVVLLCTYEMGRQPFGLASPAAWLRGAGHSVTCADLSVEPLPVADVAGADLVAFYLPMHTATRLTGPVIGKVRALNPLARLAAYGLYAPMAEEHLRTLGVTGFFGGEFEPALLAFANGTSPDSGISLGRLQFLQPDRSGLPILESYPKLRMADGSARRVGYTEASRGCSHRCRHCPVVPVYDGTFRVVQGDVVLEDIRRQVNSPGGAEHISFGDPDFFNGPTHARRILEKLHQEFPALSYDVTIKIEHLLAHRELLPVLRDTGCAFVISAVESLQDDVLEKLEKGHTRADFVEAVRLLRALSLAMSPTFIPFTPWTTREGYADLLRTLWELGLAEHLAPVQLVLRLLIPAGSRLLELDDVRAVTTGFDAAALVWRWRHPDAEMDRLAASALRLVNAAMKTRAPRVQIFRQLWELAQDRPIPEDFGNMPRTVIPFMEEPWFC